LFNKDLLIFSIMTFITAVVWTSLEVYHVHTTSTVPQSLTEAIEPLDPKLNITVIEGLRSRFDENTLPKPVVTQPPVATKSAVKLTPTLTPTPTTTLNP
jgi:hypothetical protein